ADPERRRRSTPHAHRAEHHRSHNRVHHAEDDRDADEGDDGRHDPRAHLLLEQPPRLSDSVETYLRPGRVSSRVRWTRATWNGHNLSSSARSRRDGRQRSGTLPAYYTVCFTGSAKLLHARSQCDHFHTHAG